jgi:cation transport protein ChaC
VHGWHRRFCIRSTRYRGSPEAPGLVLGLDRGGSCRGIAWRVGAKDAAETLAYLDAREMPDPVYHRKVLPARLTHGTIVPAIAYVARPDWPGFCRPAPEEAAAMISRAAGAMGTNRDYLLNTINGLRAHGLPDPGLARLAALLPPAV